MSRRPKVTNMVKYELINFLTFITEGTDNSTIKKFIKRRYNKAIFIDSENDLLYCKEEMVTKHEYYVISLAIEAQYEKLNLPREQRTNQALYRKFAEKVENNLSIILFGFDMNLINELSYEKYEKKSLTTSYLAFNYTKEKYWLSFDENHQYVFSRENIHGIRKIMETLHGKQCIVFEEKDGTFIVKGICEKDAIRAGVKFKLCSAGVWSFLIPDAEGKDLEMIKFKNGKYCVSKLLDVENLPITNNVENLLETYNIDKKIGNIKIFNLIVKTIEKLIELNKGTIIVFLKNESDFCSLKEYKRAFTLNKSMIETDILENIVSIDGAIVCNFEGMFLGFGAILDGEARVKANLQRGSRYNSTLNYICKETHEEAFGIVISDDGMIDVIVKNE